MDPDELDDFDVNSAVEGIGESLFGIRGEVKDTPESTPVKDVAPAPAATPPAEAAPTGEIVPGQNSTIKPLPKAWKKEMAPVWEKLPPEVHDYVHAREADVLRGFQQYQTGHQAWDTLTKPFAQVFQQNLDVNPVQIMQGLMNTHLQLLQSPPEQKKALAQKILTSYGINLSDLPAPAADPALLAELHSLREQVSSLHKNFTSREQQEYDLSVQNNLRAIEAFAAKPENAYFNEVGNDIIRFLQTGVATDLASAYELACWANPGVRAKMLAKQQAPTPTPPPPRDTKTGKFRNLDTVNPDAPRTRTGGTIDSTIDSIVASHYSKH